MNHAKLIMLCLLMAAGSNLYAETVDVEQPGSLKHLVANPGEISTLTVTGHIDASDLEWAATNLTALKSLDLGSAHIAEYNGDALTIGNGFAKANHIATYSLAGLSAESVVLPSSATTIAEGVFAGSNIKSIVIPANITSIGLGAFAGCTKLQSVSIPSSVKSIGPNAFADCSALTEATILAPIKAVPASAFARCTALRTINLPSTITAIDSAAFADCHALTSVNFPASLTKIGDEALRNTAIQSVDLSGCKSLKSIGAWAMAENPNLTAVTLPESVTKIGAGAFFHNPDLAKVTIPEQVTTIPNYAFTGDSSVETDNFMHDNVTTIGNYALKDWSTQSVMHLPVSLTYLGDYAMAGWSSLNQLFTQGQQVPQLGTDVWMGVDQPNTTLYVADDLTDAFMSTPQWQEFNVAPISTNVIEVIDDSSSNVRGFIHANAICIEASTDIDLVEVYDTAGLTLVRVNPQATSAQIDINGMSTRVFLVRVLLSNGNIASVKLAR